MKSIDEWARELTRNERLVDSATPKGLKYIDYGVSRVCFEIRIGEYTGHILKIERNEGFSTNQSEVRTWERVKGTDVEKYFCPVVDYGSDYEYVVMKRADVNLSRSRKQEIRENIMKELDDSGVVDGFLDTALDNFGVYNGRGVIIDYPLDSGFC